jgi:hypothetical protein
MGSQARINGNPEGERKKGQGENVADEGVGRAKT